LNPNLETQPKLELTFILNDYHFCFADTASDSSDIEFISIHNVYTAQDESDLVHIIECIDTSIGAWIQGHEQDFSKRFALTCG